MSHLAENMQRADMLDVALVHEQTSKIPAHHGPWVMLSRIFRWQFQGFTLFDVLWH